MKNKTPLIFGGIFILLIIVYLTTSIHSPEKTKGAVPLFKGDIPVIDKLEITKKLTEPVTIENIKGTWTITKPFTYPAKKASVEEIITMIDEVYIDGVISEKKESQKEFNVTDSTGVVVKAYSGGKVVLDVIIGKYSIDLSHTYARRADSNKIELWRGLLTAFINKNIDDWRDNTVFSYNPGDIINIKAVKGAYTRELALVDSTWYFKENGKEKPINQEKAKTLANTLASLTSGGFGETADIAKVAQSGPDTKVTFKIRSGDEISFDLWTPATEKDTRYIMRKKDGEVLFRFFKVQGEQLMLDYDQLKAAS